MTHVILAYNTYNMCGVFDVSLFGLCARVCVRMCKLHSVSLCVSNNEHVHLFLPGAFIHNLARKP